MTATSSYIRSSVITFKVITVIIGLIFITVSGVILYESARSYFAGGTLFFSGTVEIFATLAALISGVTLVTILPESVRVRFSRPRSRTQPNPTYGFATLLAIGLGATIGSPLFIILPVNIEQYAIVSVVSLVVAGLLSIGIARIYSYMFRYSSANGVDVVGGPTFVRISTRERSVRYFLARFSLWIANTSLAAFCAIFFFTFTFQTLPVIAPAVDLSQSSAMFLGYLIVGLFAVWFVINAFFEKRFIRMIARAQILFLAVMVGIIVAQGLILGIHGNWNLSGLMATRSGNLPLDIIENTGYLFILFFGFQEIQSVTKESLKESRIPVISRLFNRGKPYSASRYIPLSMYTTVILATCIMLFDALTMFSVHPSLGKLQQVQIPALYIVSTYISPQFQIYTLVAFLLATVTTFVPAFIAASKHLRELVEDGFFPRSLRGLSWVFTIILIAILSLTNPNFLVNITDFMVLVALAIICLSAFWLRNISKKVPKGVIFVALGSGMFAFFVDALLYPQNPTVVLLGVIAVILSFLTYDVVSLGTIGLQIFVIFFDLVAFMFEAIFPSTIAITYPPFFGPLAGHVLLPFLFLRIILLLSAATVFVNIIMDVFVIKRIDLTGALDRKS